ncbi:hypothetical protein DL96DRAFT_1723463 [Flagelloscypha sp. PMI_526]|nr:hypothetical protein DL96DRAFT_1723463 [Flagelloscypha sp. PMI_526]
MPASTSSELELINLEKDSAGTHFNTQNIVELEDQSKAIVQFRETRLNLSLYDVVRRRLGPLVPTIDKVATEAAVAKHVYVINFVDDSMWNSALGALPGAWEGDAVIPGQLGAALSHCTVSSDCSESIDSYVIPRLRAVLSDNIPSNRLQLRRSVEDLVSIAPNLKLPLSLSYVDLNAKNILITREGPPKLIGPLDWGLSRYLPFGVDGCQIRLMSVINRDRVDYPDKSGSTMIATSFWNAFTDISADLHSCIIDAMINLEFPEVFEDVFKPLAHTPENIS